MKTMNWKTDQYFEYVMNPSTACAVIIQAWMITAFLHPRVQNNTQR